MWGAGLQEKKRICGQHTDKESDDHCGDDAGSLTMQRSKRRHAAAAREGRTLKENGMVKSPAPNVFWAMVNIVLLRVAVPRATGWRM